MIRLTKDNETRRRALKILASDADDLTRREWETLTSERQWFLGLSIEMGIPAGILSDLMTSREYTEYLARGVVERAASEVYRTLKD